MTFEEYLNELEKSENEKDKEILTVLKKVDEDNKRTVKERDEALKEKEVLKNFFNGANLKDIKTQEQQQKEELEKDKENLKNIISNW